MKIKKQVVPKDSKKAASKKAKDFKVIEAQAAIPDVVVNNMDDFLDMRAESNLTSILEKNKEILSKTQIFSDYITRINSKSQRKLRVLVITSNFD